MSIFSIPFSASTTGWGSTVAKWSNTEAAGAIHSLQWPVGCAWKQAREFLNSADDGRLLQSAVSYDLRGEAFNPTEGGALASIGFATPSLSKLLKAVAGPNTLETVNRMAFWKPVSGVQVSNHILSKRVVLGAGPWNRISYDVAFSLPENETHGQAQFEILTGYMPTTFSVFETLNRATRTLSPVSDGPGEQPWPPVFSTPDGEYAMGVWVPAWGNSAPSWANGGYGRWRFHSPDNTNKWNCVQRVNNPARGLVQSFHVEIAFGTKADVVGTLCGLPG